MFPKTSLNKKFTVHTELQMSAKVFQWRHKLKREESSLGSSLLDLKRQQKHGWYLVFGILFLVICRSNEKNIHTWMILFVNGSVRAPKIFMLEAFSSEILVKDDPVVFKALEVRSGVNHKLAWYKNPVGISIISTVITVNQLKQSWTVAPANREFYKTCNVLL